MNRREFLRTAGGATGAVAALGASGTAAAQENGTATSGGNETATPGGNGTATPGGGAGGGDLPPPDFGGYLADANNYDGSVENEMGQDEVMVRVGAGDGLAFGPAAVHVANGATVSWEWTGEGGTHNVVSVDDVFNSGSPVAAEGESFEYTFEEDGIYNYYCDPHRGSGMLGSIVVGTDYPAVQQSGGRTPVNPEHVGVPFQAHWVGISTILAIFVSLLFSFYTLKYGESPNTKGGND